MDVRLSWLLIGCGIGFVAGYIVRSLREIKEKVTDVDERVKKRETNDEGLIRYPLLYDIVLVLIVAMTVYAAITSQLNANSVKDQQHKIDDITSCNRDYLNKTIVALNSRTAYAQEQAFANVDLQTAFNKVVQASLQKPPPTEAQARKIVEEYATALQHFLEVSKKNNAAIASNPYPTSHEFTDCINKR
jgi:hypothetical protein